MYEMEEFFLTLFGIIAVFLLIWLVILVVEYFLKGMALSRMARNAGLPSPGLAWVPFANNHLLGTLCERSGISRTGRAWKFSVILPVLDLVRFLGGGASLAFLEEFTDYLYYDWDYPPMLWENLFSGIGSLIGLAFTVLMAVALYNLYCDYAPGKEVLFTVLSVIFSGMAQAIILFVLRDRVPVSARMGGYPPPGAYPQGPAGPYPGGPYGPQWNQPPRQGGPYTTQWGQPPQQGGPYTTQWGAPPQQNTPYGGPWGQAPSGQPGPQPSQSPYPDPQDPPPSGEGPEIK